MLELSRVKNYIRVDVDEDDELIKMLMESAYSYVKGAIDNFEEKCKDKLFENKAEHIMLFLIADWYDSRQYSRYEKYNEVSHIVTAMIQQIQLEDAIV